MSPQSDAGDQDGLFSIDLLGDVHAIEKRTDLFDKPLTHNELITAAFDAVRGGSLGPYETFELSVSSIENPIQMLLRHQKSGRVRVANNNRSDGSIEWDTTSFL